MPAYDLSNSQTNYNNQNLTSRVDRCSNDDILNEQFALSEMEENNVKTFLDSWNMRFLFQTSIGEYNVIFCIFLKIKKNNLQ